MIQIREVILNEFLREELIKEMETRAEHSLMFTYELEEHIGKCVWLLENDGVIEAVALMEDLSSQTINNIKEDLINGFMCENPIKLKQIINKRDSVKYVCALFSFNKKNGYGKILTNHIKGQYENILLSALFTAEKFWSKMGFQSLGGTSNYYYYENKNAKNNSNNYKIAS